VAIEGGEESEDGAEEEVVLATVGHVVTSIVPTGLDVIFRCVPHAEARG